MDEVFHALVTRYDRQLVELAHRLSLLLAVPVGVSLDPLRATDPNSGKYIPQAVSEIVCGIRRHLRLPLVVPTFGAWDTRDCGPGVPRQQLREVMEGIQQIRRVLSLD